MTARWRLALLAFALSNVASMTAQGPAVDRVMRHRPDDGIGRLSTHKGSRLVACGFEWTAAISAVCAATTQKYVFAIDWSPIRSSIR